MAEMLIVEGSPHIHCHRTVRGAMWRVVIALMPALAVGVMQFGIDALIVVGVSVAAAMLAEYLINRFMLGRGATISDGSAILTGLLLGMSLPSSLPWWMAVVGAVAAIGIGKMAFGGLGCNVFNPAMVGRVFLLISFPAAMTSWPVPQADGVTGATFLSSHTEALTVADAALGHMGGSIGEVGAIALIVGFLFLLASKVVSGWIPVSILATVALMSLLTGGDVVMELLSGGLLIGALFMATDYVTSPMTPRGMVVFGVGIGAITFIIRHWGAYPEGVSFAILLMNGLVPLINAMCRPKRFGERGSGL